MVLVLDGEKCEVCEKRLINEKTYKDVDMRGYTHNFCRDCYENRKKDIEKILKRKIQGTKDIHI